MSATEQGGSEILADERVLRRDLNLDGTKATRVKRRLTSRTATVAALLITILWTIPTFGLFVTSFRPAELINTTGWWTVFENWGWTLDNYREVLFSSSSSSPQLGSYFVNSLAITIPVVVFATVLAAMAAYALAWIKFPFADGIFIIIFALQIVPLQMALIPLLQIFTSTLKPLQEWMHSIVPAIPDETYLQVWIAHTIFGLPLAIFLLHNFISEIPNELIEAARVDGANHGRSSCGSSFRCRCRSSPRSRSSSSSGCGTTCSSRSSSRAARPTSHR